MADRESTGSEAERDRHREVVCSFCGKGRDRVRTLIAGPDVHICDECVELCGDILDKEHGPPSVGRNTASKPVMFDQAANCALCHLPTPIGELLPIPDRGFLCAACLEMVKLAAEQSKST